MSENQALEQPTASVESEKAIESSEAPMMAKEEPVVSESSVENKPSPKERRDVIHFSQRQLAERLDRAKKAGVTDFMKGLGFEKEEDLRRTIDLYNEKQPEKLEQLLSGRIQELENGKTSLEKQLASEKLSKDVILASFESGLTDASYGEFLYLRHLGTLTDQELETVTPRSFFSQLKNDADKAHLFRAVAKPADTKPVEAPKPTSDDGPQEINVFRMKDDEYKKYKRSLGIKR